MAEHICGQLADRYQENAWTLGDALIMERAADPEAFMRLPTCQHCGGNDCRCFYAPDPDVFKALLDMTAAGRLLPKPSMIYPESLPPAPPPPEPEKSAREKAAAVLAELFDLAGVDAPDPAETLAAVDDVVIPAMAQANAAKPPPPADEAEAARQEARPFKPTLGSDRRFAKSRKWDEGATFE